MRASRLQIIAVLLIACLSVVGAPPAVSCRAAGTGVKNVILLIPDGMSLSDLVLTRWYQNGRPLAMDAFAEGLVRTYCADALITDSAAAASAYATGRKIESEMVSIAPAVASMPGAFAAPPEEAHRPLPTILEAARLEGLATGLVSTSALVDATPAAFASHVLNRYTGRDDIAEQMVHAGIDVLLAGGTDFLVPGPAKYNRKDGEDLTRILGGLGYTLVKDRDGLARAAGRPGLWGIFAPVNLVSRFDRLPGDPPDLAELTRAALRILSGDKDGFFLMVESGEIDSYGHDNDPIGVISEVLAFDEALRVAVDFAVADGRTAVIACSDHPTGGLSIENYGNLDALLSVLKKARLTSYAVADRIAPDGANLEEVLARDYGLADLTRAEREAAQAGLKAGNLPPIIGPILAARAGLAFGTDSHTGEDVPLFGYHPEGFRPTDMVGSGVIQNVDVNRYILKVLGLDLEMARKALHQPASLFEARGGKVVLDRADPANPVVRVTRGRDVLELPVNKNQAVLNGRLLRLNGLVTVIGDRIWVPRQAIELLR
jgi:alkaline phosphatase